MYLSVEIGEALSIGDCHAAQGDGEVCSTGIEVPMDVTIQVYVDHDKEIRHPHFESTGPYTSSGKDEPMYGTTDISDDLILTSGLIVRNNFDNRVTLSIRRDRRDAMPLVLLATV